MRDRQLDIRAQLDDALLDGARDELLDDWRDLREQRLD